MYFSTTWYYIITSEIYSQRNGHAIRLYSQVSPLGIRWKHMHGSSMKTLMVANRASSGDRLPRLKSTYPTYFKYGPGKSL